MAAPPDASCGMMIAFHGRIASSPPPPGTRCVSRLKQRRIHTPRRAASKMLFSTIARRLLRWPDARWPAAARRRPLSRLYHVADIYRKSASFSTMHVTPCRFSCCRWHFRRAGRVTRVIIDGAARYRRQGAPPELAGLSCLAGELQPASFHGRC